MKPIRTLVWPLIILLGGGLTPQADAAPTYTDGTASFTVNLISIPGNYSPRVDAYWVTDNAGRFLQTVRRDAGTRRGYLDQWEAARGTWPYNQVDGYSGATISTWGTFTVTWDCRDTNNVLMPDGIYKFWIEMTDRNGQGPYTTNGIPFYKGLTNVNNTYPNQQYIQNMGVTYTPILAYDIAVTRLTPSFGSPDLPLPVVVTVTNKTSIPEHFTLTLSNATSGAIIDRQTISNLEGNGQTNLVFTWNTAGLGLGSYSLVAYASPVPNETVLSDNTLTRVITLRPPTHDVAVNGLSLPAQVYPNSRTNVTVGVTNKGDLTETLAVVLTDDTDSIIIGTNVVSGLTAQSGTTTIFSWNTTNATWGTHTLTAVAGPVAEETALADNTASILATVLPPSVTNTFIVRNGYWRYHDQGLDLGTTWRTPGYNDSAWPLGRGPLGYTDAPINTTLSYGPDGDEKYLTYYFRTTFTITNRPSSFILNLRRDDGAVVYHNGVEIYRVNMPSGTIGYTTLAPNAIGGADETTYFQTNLTTTNAVVGTNLLAVEIHQSARDSSDLSFDLDLLGVIPPFVPAHDIAIASMSAPVQVLPGTTTNLTVTVTNQGNYRESFAVTLTDDTESVVLGTQTVTNLATNAAAALLFPWTAPAGAWMNHSLRAVAGPVPSEINRADNTNLLVVFVAPPMETNVCIVRSNVWRFSDAGLDLTRTPWKEPDYMDSAWSVGRGSFGYGDPVTTTNAYGPSATNKYPTYYYRTTFNLDLPPTWLQLRLRCDDGAVIYLNGAEAHRVNLPGEPVTYSTWATASVDGTSETTYFQTDLPITHAVVGVNVLAVEVHQVSATNNDLSFDLELRSIQPIEPRLHEVAAIELKPQADAQVGDLMKVAVSLTNAGNASETFTVYLRDRGADRILASTVVSNLAVGTGTTVMFDWNTTGAAPGDHTLEAYTVRAGITNVAGMASAPASLTGTGFGLNLAGSSGSVGGRCAALAASTNLLAVGAGATLELYSTPDLAKLGQVRLPGLIEGIAVSGSYAYVACGAAGVQFVDLSVPTAPLHKNSFNTSGHAYGVTVYSNFLYVADGISGLRIVSIASPGQPTLAGAYYTEGPARALAIANRRAYVLDAHKGLVVLNLADPARPTLMGTGTVFSSGQALALSGAFAYIVDANNRFLTFNIANPAAPTLIGSALLTNLVAQSVVARGTIAYVAAGTGGLVTVNAATPTAPAVVALTPAPGEASALALVDTTLFVASGFAGFQMRSVAAPPIPALQADRSTAIRASDVAVQNGLAYVAAGETGLRIFAVTNPVAPVLLSAYTGVTNARAIALAGSTVYVGDGQYGLKIVDVTNPLAPAPLGAYASAELGFIRDVAVAGTQVLLNDGRKVVLLDASDPANPVWRATHATPAFAFALTVDSGHAYLACGDQGVVIWTLAPSALTLAGTYDTPGFATGIAVASNMAHVADGPGGWLMLDVTDPSAPAAVGVSTTVGPIVNVAVSGVLATLANGANAALQLDVTAPLTPVGKKAFAGLVRALRMTAAGEQVFVAEDEAGLAILDSSADADRDGLPDAWEQSLVEGNPNDNLQSLWDIRPGDDLDGDGQSNYAEYLAGTSPVDAASRFVVSMADASPSGPVTITWTTVPGRMYTVHRSSDLSQGFSVLADNLPATQTSFVDPQPTNPSYYMISVR